MFIDEIKILLKAGKWWDWLVSWRREKCVPNGGPRWGDGGHGWNVFLRTSRNINTLSDFRNKKVMGADDGVKWGSELMHGARWEDLVLNVPVGTLVKNSQTGEIIIDLDQENMLYLLCQWGRWGFWNAHFTSSTRQAPSFAELWDIGEEQQVILELKLVADIWIIGVPSAGKSTFIGTVTNVKPKIGDYPFTTLIPNLWVLDYKDKSLVLEDVPGLIPGASQGKWLWIEFLKHIERTKVLLHLLDLYRLDQLLDDYENIRFELGQFNPELLEKEEIVVFSKWDLLDMEMKQFIVSEFEKRFGKKKTFIISSATGEGIESLKDHLITNYTTAWKYNSEDVFVNQDKLKVIDLREEDDPKNIDLEYLGDYLFKASWKRLEQIVRMTDFQNPEAVMRVFDVMDKLGVIKKIESKLGSILRNQEIDNSFFFEWESDENDFTPKVEIGGKVIELNKLKFNL
jgi:GTP-binding protein